MTNSLPGLIAVRLLYGLLALWVLLTFVFFAIDLLPGDLAVVVLGREAPPEAIENFRRMLGLDLPLHIRYLTWIGNLLQGDFGVSLATGRDISGAVMTRLGNTLFLAALAALIAVPLALGLGLLAALYRNGVYDRVVSGVTLALISLPDFFVAYTLILFVAIRAGLFPAISTIAPDAGLGDRLYVSLLPALTLVLFVTAHMMRMTRAAIIDLLSSPYIEMAKLKGVSQARIILRHALPNAWAPIINVIVFNLAYLVLGVVVIEVVFAYPGLGQLLVDSVSRRDIPVVQACCLVFAVIYLLLNLLADVVAIISNPRIRHPL